MPPPAGEIERNIARAEVLGHLPRQLRSAIELAEPTFVWPPEPDANDALVHADAAGIYVVGTTEAGPHETVRLPLSAGPRNTQFVGWDLVGRFPASLELAGIILLLAMFGAVILARRQIEYGEDELRETVGMTRLHDWDDDSDSTDAGGTA
jgi:hypothetical protein